MSATGTFGILKPATLATALLFSCLTAQSSRAVTVFSAAGGAPSDIQPTVDLFRSTLGNLNPNAVGSFGSGRREINWDGVPDAFAAPNNFPANFFNMNSPRGAVFSTPGTGFQVSANAASGVPVEFGNINASYPGLFETFSPQRLFAALGSNVFDVNFFVPGSNTPALTRGFGAVFTDVDLPDVTSMQFFGANDQLLGTFLVPPASSFAPNETLSFLGVDFGLPTIAMVRIIAGSAAFGPSEAGPIDLVALDDFVYGEPVPSPVPLPAAAPMFAAAVLGAGLLRWRRKVRT
jgi:hypothetical protein